MTETTRGGLIGLDPTHPIWERFFRVAPLVLVGSKDPSGTYNVARPSTWRCHWGGRTTPVRLQPAPPHLPQRRRAWPAPRLLSPSQPGPRDQPGRRAAHAGLNPEAGLSAILELSHRVQRLFALNDPARGITVNVGTIDGGLRPNVVAPEASAVVDVRAPTMEAGGEVEAAIRALTPVQAGLAIEVEGGIERPPMEPTPRNQALWRHAAAALGLELEQATVGGASDGNLTSLYTATLDGLGPVGDRAHAVHEYVERARLAERAALLALLVPAACGA